MAFIGQKINKDPKGLDEGGVQSSVVALSIFINNHNSTKHMEKHTIEEIKSEYEALKKKYSLPSFNELAEEFDIEKLAEKEKTSFLLRDTRRVINEKLSAYFHLFETFRNPGTAPMFVILMLKNATETDAKTIEDLYKKMAKLEIESIKLDTIYNENLEAEFIKKISVEWQKIKKQIFDLIERFDSNFDSNSKETRKGYYG